MVSYMCLHLLVTVTICTKMYFNYAVCAFVCEVFNYASNFVLLHSVALEKHIIGKEINFFSYRSIGFPLGGED